MLMFLGVFFRVIGFCFEAFLFGSIGLIGFFDFN
jgi:hypothetical protein